MMRQLFILICFCLAFIVQCGEARQNDETKRTENRKSDRAKKNKAKDEAVKDITARIALFVKNWNDNEMKGVAAISSKDAILMGHSLDTVYGRKAIYTHVLAAKSFFDKINIRIIELVPINKKYAFHIEEWKGFDDKNTVVVEKGRSLIVWKKIKGEWYIIRHMFNYVGNSYS